MQEERQQNEFNNAIGYIQRLDKIFYMLASNKIDNDSTTYIKSLKLLFHELVGEMNDKEIKTFKDLIRKLEKEMIFVKTTQKTIPRELLYEIEDLEISLRSIYKNSGLQNRYKDTWFSDKNSLSGLE